MQERNPRVLSRRQFLKESINTVAATTVVATDLAVNIGHWVDIFAPPDPTELTEAVMDLVNLDGQSADEYSSFLATFICRAREQRLFPRKVNSYDLELSYNYDSPLYRFHFDHASSDVIKVTPTKNKAPIRIFQPLNQEEIGTLIEEIATNQRSNQLYNINLYVEYVDRVITPGVDVPSLPPKLDFTKIKTAAFLCSRNLWLNQSFESNWDHGDDRQLTTLKQIQDVYTAVELPHLGKTAITKGAFGRIKNLSFDPTSYTWLHGDEYFYSGSDLYPIYTTNTNPQNELVQFYQRLRKVYE